MLSKMIHVVRHLIQGKPQLEVAANAALAYLALITAFQQEGLLELEWVPKLAIDVGDTEYEVRSGLKIRQCWADQIDRPRQQTFGDGSRRRGLAERQWSGSYARNCGSCC